MNQAIAVRTAAALFAAFLAGQGWAGEAAWMGTYGETRAGESCEFVLVRDDRRAETRGCGRPTRVWRRLDDGIELLELHPDRGELVRWSPGDLRALGREPDWSQASGLVAASLREALGAGKPARIRDQPALRYHGKDPAGREIELDWLTDAQLPERYHVGDALTGETIVLRTLARADDSAFTPTANLRQVDGADLGD